MSIQSVFNNYLNLPYTDSLKGDFDEAVKAIGSETMEAGDLQAVLDAIATE